MAFFLISPFIISLTNIPNLSPITPLGTKPTMSPLVSSPSFKSSRFTSPSNSAGERLALRWHSPFPGQVASADFRLRLRRSRPRPRQTGRPRRSLPLNSRRFPDTRLIGKRVERLVYAVSYSSLNNHWAGTFSLHSDYAIVLADR